MYRDTVSESQPVKLTDKEFRALEELIYERLKPKHLTLPEANETKSPPPSLGDILVTDLCDRIGELESWREGVDSGQSPTANILSLQNRVTSIEGRITDLSTTVTQAKAEQDNLDKLVSKQRHTKINTSILQQRITDLTETLRPIKEEYDRYSFHDNTNVYARLNSMDKRIKNLTSQTEGDE